MQNDSFLKRKRDVLSKIGCEIIKGQHRKRKILKKIKIFLKYYFFIFFYSSKPFRVCSRSRRRQRSDCQIPRTTIVQLLIAQGTTTQRRPML